MTSSINTTQILSPNKKRGFEQQQQQTDEQVQVDMSKMIGRIKPKPVCIDVTLKQQSMHCEEISKYAFDADGLKATWKNDLGSQELSVVSSSSSTASRETGQSDMMTDGFKSNQSDTDLKISISSSTSFSHGEFLHRKSKSELVNLKVKSQTISRNGRQTQRWYTDPATHTLYRMTTGCIPILKDGKILFCSASRKPEWILPKGGWEKDEAMEESAIRETFEEAGVFGIIGPALSEIQFETRKGKKRRIEFEEVQRKAKQIREARSSSPKAVPLADEATTPPVATFSKNQVVSTTVADACQEEKFESEKAVQINYFQEQQQCKTNQHTSDGDNVSVASETSLSHAHVKMSLFPLYVTEVKETWPEQGRFRKVVNIDEAIQIAVTRPYFQRALKELKERNLHVPHELQQPLQKSTTGINVA